MEYTYIICPKCMNGLIERKEADAHKAIYCLKCGNKLVPALYGEKRIDQTKYKMTMNETVSIPQLSWGNNRCKWR